MKKMILVLTIVMVVSGLVLAASYTLFLPRITLNQKKALDDSLNTLFSGDSLSFSLLDTDGTEIYKAVADDGTLVGYAVGVTGAGYGGPIKMLAGLTPDLKRISGLQIVENVETPGLGSRIADVSFRDQFRDLDPAEEITFIKNGVADKAKNQIDALTGSTISTQAVTKALSGSLKDVIGEIKRMSNGE